MNIAVGFGCLVSVAVLIGLPDLAKCATTCSCAFVHSPNKGCTLSKQNPAPSGMACQCIVADTKCTGTVVACNNPQSTNCTSDLTNFNRCMEGVYDGKGDCCGYSTPHNPCKNVGGPATRIFGALGNLAGNLAGGALGALGGALGGSQQGFQQRPPHHHQQGFNPGLQQGFNHGFQQQGFNPGFQQQGFNPGLQQQGFNPGFPQQGFPGQVGGGVGSSGSNSCRRWCRTPQGQAYCCETAADPLTAVVVKQGQCPPVRPQCPPIRLAPALCSSDGACGGLNKCCFDTCLQHHTCKPPIGFGK